ncbi:hypothetical protein CA13_46200 [Planctomycetes bacterium CA13]|uniref:IncA protein n=1 Tax=Novipirellula herctigrandis TaxID=2527986 RepID=A0A5C5Z7T3_9BACT|nr:hypothetical protein CA13_46200 [Planctomycetes bacterium CA13]
MSGRRRQAISPTLFPFLAVLVCTLGTLILFLALVAQKATKVAEQQVAEAEQAKQQRMAEHSSSEEPSLTQGTVASMIAEEQVRVAQVVAFRDSQAADLENRRDQLTHLEDHLQRIRDELMRLSDEVKQATGETEATAVDTATIDFLKSKLKEEEKAVAELKAQTENNTPRVVIVPHKGPNGTDRRPVYLECSKDGVMIWPEGVRITQQQLDNTSRGANPIDAALRIVRHHAMQNYGDSIPPYPLLVVRPDGIESYAAARGAMEDWDDQFGYELVPSKVQLAFNQPDPQLKKRIDLAIQDAISNQQARVHASGIARSNGRTRSRTLPTLSARQMDAQGTANGFRSASDNLQGTSSYYSSNSNPYATGETVSGRTSAGRTSAGRTSAGGTARAGQGNAIATNNTSGSGTPGSGSDPLSPAIDANRMHQIASDMQSAAAAVRAQSLAEEAASVAELNHVLGAGDSNFSVSQNFGQDPAMSGKAGGGNQSDGVNGGELGSFLNQQYGDLDPASGPGKPNTPGDTGASSESNMSLNSPNTSDAGSISAVGQIGKADDSGNTMPTQSHQFELPDTSDPFAKTSGNAGTGRGGQSSVSTSSSVASGQAGAGGSDSSPPPENGSMGGSMSMQKQSTPPADSRGKNWAVPEQVARARGNTIVRTIRVLCYEDQFVLLAPATGGATEMFGFSDENVSRATNELGDAVRKRIQQWGPSLPGGRWQPVLDVEVMPQGEGRYEQLKQMMQRSGVDVRGADASLGTNSKRGITP